MTTKKGETRTGRRFDSSIGIPATSCKEVTIGQCISIGGLPVDIAPRYPTRSPSSRACLPLPNNAGRFVLDIEFDRRVLEIASVSIVATSRWPFRWTQGTIKNSRTRHPGLTRFRVVAVFQIKVAVPFGADQEDCQLIVEPVLRVPFPSRLIVALDSGTRCLVRILLVATQSTSVGNDGALTRGFLKVSDALGNIVFLGHPYGAFKSLDIRTIKRFQIAYTRIWKTRPQQICHHQPSRPEHLAGFFHHRHVSGQHGVLLCFANFTFQESRLQNLDDT